MPAEPVDMSAIDLTIASLRSLIEFLPRRLAVFAEGAAGAKPSSGGWSKKQELGHLIDSASNNHQRIVRARTESGLALPGYDGDLWVELHYYQDCGWLDLIRSWHEFNRQLLRAADSVSQPGWLHELSVGGSAPMTLGFVFVDYLKHMLEHLRHLGVQVDDLLPRAQEEARSYPEKPAPSDRPINELIRLRWSPRALDEGRAVERDKILTILEAARWAPSCFNDQPRFFLVFDGSDTAALEKARACLVPGNAWAAKAPVLVLSVARETFESNGKPNRWAQHDVGLATENLLLEAVEVGLVSHPMAGFDADRAREEFAIPDGFTPMAMIAIGYPYRGSLDVLDEKVRKGERAARERKSVGQIAFAGSWGRAYN